jgi:hypothetical protein
MANDSTDVLMTFIDSSGEGVAAECASVWNIQDGLKAGFSPGCYFEIEDFTFGGGLESGDSGSEKNGGRGSSSSGKGNSLSQRGENAKDGDSDKSKRSSRGNKFANYIMSGSLMYPLDVQEISFSRQLDMASPVLFWSCLKLIPFTQAIIVKRKVIGGVASRGVSVNLMGFFRLEFDKPLITSVEWEDGEIVKEKLKFVCRGGKVIYKPQKPDGTLGDPISITWKPQRDLTGNEE